MTDVLLRLVAAGAVTGDVLTGTVDTAQGKTGGAVFAAILIAGGLLLRHLVKGSR